MTFIITAGAFFLLIFAFSFFSKKSFGLPVLGLITGSMLAAHWGQPVVDMLNQVGIGVSVTLTMILVKTMFLLVPAVILSVAAKKTHGLASRIFGSLVVALVAVLLTYDVIAELLTVDEASRKILDVLTPYFGTVLSICALLAVLETVLVSKRHHSSKH